MSRATRRDEGFTLIEMTVALFIILIVSLALASVFVSSLTTVAQAKQRQSGTALATQAMEELRALPYATVLAGLYQADLGTDPHIVVGTPPRLSLPDNGIDEALVVNSSTPAPQPPLSPHVSTQAINNVTYTVSTYVTKNPTTSEQAYNLTVVVEWTGKGFTGTRRTVERSTTYSPSSCLSTAEHPFSGPCQALFSGQAGLTAAGITVTNPGDSTSDILGFSGRRIELGLPVLSTSLSVEQVAKLTASAVTTSALTVDSSGTSTTSGGRSISVSADTDPSSTGSASGEASTPGQDSASLPLTGPVGAFAAVPMSNDAASLSAQVATGASGCVDEANATLVTGQPCVSGGNVTQGSPAAIDVTLADATTPLSWNVASVSDSAEARGVVARYVNGGGAHCAGTSGVGCVYAGASRTLGTIRLGALPSGGGVPASFTSALTVAGVRERASAEMGLNRAVAGPSVTRSGGTLKYWDGTGYQELDLTGLTSDVSLGTPITVTGTYDTAAGPTTITLSYTFNAGAAGSASMSPLDSADPGCQQAVCTSSATGGSPLKATLTYTVSRGGTDVASFVVQANLGALLARTSYQAAPSGS